MKELFIKSDDEFLDLQCEYNLEDCGESGKYPGWHWYQDDEAEIAVYTKPEE